MAGAGAAATAAVAVHLANGHAGAGSWSETVTVSAQVAHFVAAGIWAGGLIALLRGVRGEPSEAKAAAVRRFSMVAGGRAAARRPCGDLRAIDELAALSQRSKPATAAGS